MVLKKMIKHLSTSLWNLSFELSLSSSLGECTFSTMIIQQRTLRTIHVVLSVTNCNLSTAHTILWCTKKLFQIDNLNVFLHTNIYNPLLLTCPFSLRTSCTPAESTLHIANFLAAVVSDPELYRLLTLHAPKFISLFHCLVRTKGSSQARENWECLLTR